MVDSRFDSRIQPGTALSRSRFEDATFSHGENLKSGVHTRWGTVRVQQHTELELRFTDPATGQLHRCAGNHRQGFEPVRHLSGYSDYRHIPVIGKGVTFQLPGSPDRWGMMCEADLEEVYRRRSLSVGLMKTYLLTVITHCSSRAACCRLQQAVRGGALPAQRRAARARRLGVRLIRAAPAGGAHAGDDRGDPHPGRGRGQSASARRQQRHAARRAATWRAGSTASSTAWMAWSVR